MLSSMSAHCPTAVARVMIVDPHGGSRAGLRFALAAEPEFAVVAEAPDLTRALDLLDEGAKVDVVALDGRAARPDPAAAIAAFQVPVVVMRVEAGPEFVRQTLANGAAAHARKDDAYAVANALRAALT